MKARLTLRMVDGNLNYEGPWYQAWARVEAFFSHPDYRGFSLMLERK